MCKYEFFNFDTTKYGYYNCSVDTTSEEGGYGCKKLTDINSVNELDNMYYCASGKNFGCNGDFKCKKTEYVKMCKDSSSPFARKNLDSSDLSNDNMKDFNDYLKLDSVKDFCNEYYDLCVETSGTTSESQNLFTKIINNGEKKILANKLGLKNENDLTNSCVDIMNKYGKYCNNCTYENIRDNSKVKIYKKNINNTEIGYPNDKILPAQIGKEEAGVNLKQDEYYFISGSLDNSIEENKVRKTALNRDITYDKFPNTTDFGKSSLLKNMPDSDNNGCINNLSLEDAKVKCTDEKSCNGFFTYNDTKKDRVCFKGNINIEEPKKSGPGTFYIKK